MNFVSPAFVLFFFGIMVVLWALRRAPLWRSGALVLGNLFFYAYAGVYFLPLLLSSVFLNWGAGRALAQAGTERRRQVILGLAVVVNLSLLAFFKYYEFFLLQIEGLFAVWQVPLRMPLALADLAFPVGISFYTFQGIAYCVEQYRDASAAPQPFVRVLAFLSFFPTVLAGPLLRPGQFFPQWQVFAGEQPPAVVSPGTPVPCAWGTVADDAVQRGFALILSGLFKKVVLASYLSEFVVRDAFQGPEGFSSWGLLMAVYGYTVQIYCDFSGYSDMAIGIALLLGFSLPQNFAAPYLAGNLQEFWRRWHITLSSWLRDYLYIPLGGNKRGNKHVNLMLTMILGGLWHGAHMRFIVWGALHGAGLVVVHGFHALCSRWRGGASLLVPEPLLVLARAGSWLLTCHFVALAWIFFRAEDMARAMSIIQGIAVWGKAGEGFALLAVPAIVCGIAMQAFGPRLYTAFVRMQTRLPLVAQALILGVVLALIFRLGPDGVLPFIYFQF